ncbi:MAG: VOC family protein [Blastocatellia bacterium]|nr:VOC family protein [Blastocatellia bacterium]
MAHILQNHYVLAVHDLEVSAGFFQSLGFAIVAEPPGWVFVQKDNCMVMMGLCSDALPARELGDHSYFGYLRVDDAAGYFAELTGKGVKISSTLADKPWGMREFGVMTPEGHRLMIGQIIDEPK